jgi:hypothetical protein
MLPLRRQNSPRFRPLTKIRQLAQSRRGIAVRGLGARWWWKTIAARVVRLRETIRRLSREREVRNAVPREKSER